jgi:hypothetical protein
MSEIEILYYNYLKAIPSGRETKRILIELQLMGLALYLKNLTSDPRSLNELKEIIQEEYNLYG